MQKRCRCQSTAIGLTTEKLVKAAVEEQFSFTDVQCLRGHERKRRELFRAQRPSSTALAQEQWFGSSTTLARMAVQNSTATSDGLTERTRGVQATRAGSNETYRAEDACSAGMAENGTTSNPQSIDSRQSGRSHDEGHVSRKIDQVRTSFEPTRSILHRLESTCTVTSD